MAERILIVDDEQGIRDSLTSILEDEGYAVRTAEDGESGLELAKNDEFSCVLLDVWLGAGIDGLEVLQRLNENAVTASVIMISGHGNIETAVRATKLGAFDFIEKPLSIEKTLVTVRNAIRQRDLERQNLELQQQLSRDYEMIGRSVAMRALRKQIAIVAPTDGRVLISGESGTGKELVARAIHANSKRRELPFIEINSAALPEELVESELFGHAKGAFSGASKSKKGKFEIADGGSIFFDEIGDMSARVQAKVLRVLEEQRFDPIGSNSPVHVDVRVISATNRPLDVLIEEGNFRPDLFYRLNVIPFQVPPLRERSEDIPLLVEHFNLHFSRDYNRSPKQFSSGALERLIAYSWPGNVRELKNTVERIVIMSPDEKVEADDLPEMKEAQPSASPFRFQSFKEATDAYQREFILHKLSEFDGNVSRAAEEMGVDRSHLYRRMRNLGIPVR